MSKPKKNGVHLDSYVSTDIFNRLDRYYTRTGVPKSSVVAMALVQFFKNFSKEIRENNISKIANKAPTIKTKDSRHLHCYISKTIVDELDRYCEDTSVPKRLVISIAITQFLDGIRADRLLSHYRKEHGRLIILSEEKLKENQVNLGVSDHYLIDGVSLSNAIVAIIEGDVIEAIKNNAERSN